jgi:tRNA-dihydrouridine synthase
MTIQEQSDALWGREQFILGPMVRANSAALRWTCLHFGADVVYSEEILAQRASNCKRSENKVLDTVDFVRYAPQKEGCSRVSVPDVVSVCMRLLCIK